MQPIVKFRRLHANWLPNPAYAKDGDAGIDLPAAAYYDGEGNRVPLDDKFCWIGKGGRRLKIATGFAFEIAPGFVGKICPRSGLADKQGVTVLNAPGIIDSGYRGEVCVVLVNHGDHRFVIRPGDRIAQFVIQPVARAALVETEALSETQRGTGGFGSSGT